MKYSTYLGIIFIFYFFNSAKSQNTVAYASKDYFLVDSLDLNSITPSDSILIDSCLKIYHAANDDTSRINTISIIVEESWDDNVWPKYNNWLYKFVQSKLKNLDNPPEVQTHLKKNLAGALNNIGYHYKTHGNTLLALEYYLQSLTIEKELDNKTGIATTLNNLGAIYEAQGDIRNALDYHHQSLKISEDIKNKKGISLSFNNIGVIYESQDDLPTALDYYLKSLQIDRELNNIQGIAITLNNIGYLYEDLGKLDSALKYHEESLVLQRRIGHKPGEANSLSNIGGVYDMKKEFDLAIQYQMQSLAIYEEFAYKKGISTSLFNLATLYLKKGNVKYAESHALKSFEIAQEIGSPSTIKSAANILSEIYEKENKGMLALQMHKLFIQMRDSISSEENQAATIKRQSQYQYDKQKVLDDAENVRKVAVEQKEKEKQKILTYVAGAGILLLVVFLIFVFNRLKVTNRQKTIIDKANEELNQQNDEISAQRDQIELQKEIVEKAHEEVQASINYAQRIQTALLSTEEHWENVSKHRFILFKPRDVVSGDFFWAYSNENFVYWATADCTGHGVPGAFMSMLGVGFLNEIVAEGGETNVGRILDKLRIKIIHALEQKGSDNQRKDGMDISFCMLNKNTMELHFAGAYNPLLLVRDQSSNNDLGANRTIEGENRVMHEFKADRMPIGKHFLENVPFNMTTLSLEKNDILYTFTDGFQDQFGGKDGTKYMVKRMKQLLLEISSKDMDAQHAELTNEFDQWMKLGNTKQIDDVCLVGIRI